MIVFLHGIISRVTAGYVDLNVQGVGYRVYITEPHARKLTVGEATEVHTYHHVREDAVLLFGFESESMRDWFELLIGVSGIGPKGALQILSGVAVADFAAAILDEDLETLCTLPGIGKKTAQRLIVELKEKVGKLEWEGFAGAAEKPTRGEKAKGHPLEADAISALVALGYPEKFATEKIKQVLEKGTNTYQNVSEVIRAALQQLIP